MADDPEELRRASDRWFQAGLAWLEQNGEDARNRLSLASDIAISGLRSLLVMNGGAIVALFALIAQGSSSKFVKAVNPAMLWVAFAAFSAGVFFTLAATLVGYWSQQSIAVYEQGIMGQTYRVITGREAGDVKFSEVPNHLLVVAVVLAIGSVLCFVAGSGAALLAALGAIAAR